MRRFIPVTLLVVSIALPATALAVRPAVSPAAVAEITAGDNAPLLLDVRSRAEFSQGHLPGAVNIPHDELAARIDEISGDRWVLVYCRSGKRAGMAEQVLEDAGIEVRQVAGSWLRWQEEDRPVEIPAGPEASR